MFCDNPFLVLELPVNKSLHNGLVLEEHGFHFRYGCEYFERDSSSSLAEKFSEKLCLLTNGEFILGVCINNQRHRPPLNGENRGGQRLC